MSGRSVRSCSSRESVKSSRTTEQPRDRATRSHGGVRYPWIEGQQQMTQAPNYTDLLYEEKDGVATITINRPEKYNAFRGITCDELIAAFNRAGWNKNIGGIVLTGAGTKAFCAGGDQSAHAGSYDGKGTVGLPMR